MTPPKKSSPTSNGKKVLQALLEMQKPTLLLKYSKNSYTKFRNFYISQTYDKICWVSPKKLTTQGNFINKLYSFQMKWILVNLKDTVKFIKGRQTEKFKKNKKKLEEEYDNISFLLFILWTLIPRTKINSKPILLISPAKIRRNLIFGSMDWRLAHMPIKITIISFIRIAFVDRFFIS